MPNFLVSILLLLWLLPAVKIYVVCCVALGGSLGWRQPGHRTMSNLFVFIKLALKEMVQLK